MGYEPGKRLKLPSIQFKSIDYELTPVVQVALKHTPARALKTNAKTRGKPTNLNPPEPVERNEANLKSPTNMDVTASQNETIQKNDSIGSPVSGKSIGDYSPQSYLNYRYRKLSPILHSLEFVSSVNYKALSSLRKSNIDNGLIFGSKRETNNKLAAGKNQMFNILDAQYVEVPLYEMPKYFDPRN